MSYAVELQSRAAKQLRNLPEATRERIREAMAALANDPRPRGYTKLAGQDRYRIRVGRFRIIYAVEDPQRVVTVTDIGHRREVYR